MENKEYNRNVAAVYKTDNSKNQLPGIGSIDEIIKRALTTKDVDKDERNAMSALIDSYFSGNNPHELYSSAEQILKFVAYLSRLTENANKKDSADYNN